MVAGRPTGSPRGAGSPTRRAPECRTSPRSAGQQDAKRALEIAAAGGHNLLMVGPPGAGKTMLARRLPGILPPPDFAEALDITRVHSAAGLGDGRAGARTALPLAAPHHLGRRASSAAGRARVPGEITLAHRGVLFLDELPEFSRSGVEALRQPLEEGRVDIVARAALALVPGARGAGGRLQPVPVRADARQRARAGSSSGRATSGA